jgi:hypothetical protein
LSLLRELLNPFPKQLAKVPAGRLRLFGAIAKGERDLSAEDLTAIDAAFQTPDVGRFQSGARGRAVRLAGVLRACAPKSGSLYLNAASRDGTKVLSYWLTELEPLAWIVFGEGAFELVVPGLPAARASIRDLALIEIGNQAERVKEAT